MTLRYRSLGSGSSGNATVVEWHVASALAANHLGAQSPSRLLVDCGFGIKHLEARLLRAGLRGTDISAIFITHEHGDHIGSAVQFSERYQLPLWMSAGTYAGVGKPDLDDRLRIVSDEQSFDVGALRVTPFTVPHDAREPLQLRVEVADTSGDHLTKNTFGVLGICTDLGHASAHTLRNLAACTHLLLECNHDAGMLAASAYPAFLRNRISGWAGHLDNVESERIASALVKNGQLRHITAAHLSERNNSPAIVRTHMARALGCTPEAIAIACPHQGTPWTDVAEFTDQ
jgi:phosphoribosyl 1,2-cyclic phosphodiesterase